MPWKSTTADGISRGGGITANHAADMTDTANHVATTAHNRIATDHSLETEMAKYMVTIDLTKTNQDNKIKSTK